MGGGRSAGIVCSGLRPRSLVFSLVQFMSMVFAFLFFSKYDENFLFMNVTMATILLMMEAYCIVLGTTNRYLVHNVSLLSIFKETEIQLFSLL
jgi:hypothetical protein